MRVAISMLLPTRIWRRSAILRHCLQPTSQIYRPYKLYKYYRGEQSAVLSGRQP
eukprot:SAG25_NODE_5276_length_679_cov_0.968966_1_plen_53_part_10